jgi:predicted small lipoprotein YifL
MTRRSLALLALCLSIAGCGPSGPEVDTAVVHQGDDNVTGSVESDDMGSVGWGWTVSDDVRRIP